MLHTTNDVYCEDKNSFYIRVCVCDRDLFPRSVEENKLYV
jgi:hypothetical protein